MSRYGDVATRAVGLVLWSPGTTPVAAWDAAAKEVFPDSPSSRVKSCPKSAFLGLCEEGLVAGVPQGDYTRSLLNKEYALRGVQALRRQRAIESQELWLAATAGKDVQPNSQMDVVLALWKAGLIR